MAELKERYAAKLLKMSIESGLLREHMEQAVFLRDTLQREQAEAFLAHPGIPDDAKHGFLRRLFEEKISGDLMEFLHLAVKKGREALILPVLKTYIEMGNRHKGYVSATVVSAVPLRREQIAALQALLSKKLNKQVGIVSKVDPAVIGGLCIQIDGRLMDNTLRTQLKNMIESMKKGGSNVVDTR